MVKFCEQCGKQIPEGQECRIRMNGATLVTCPSCAETSIETGEGVIIPSSNMYEEEPAGSVSSHDSNIPPPYQPSSSSPGISSVYTPSDFTATELHRWSSHLETIGKVLLGIIIAAGCFVLIMSFQGGVSIVWLGIWLAIIAITSFLVYMSFRIVVLLLQAIASIVQNTRDMVELTKYKLKTEQESGEE